MGNMVLEDLDNQFITDIDFTELHLMTESRANDVTSTELDDKAGLRKKRALPIVPAGFAARAAFVAARGLFRGAARSTLSRSGTRVTQQYIKSGGVRNAVRDFN